MDDIIIKQIEQKLNQKLKKVDINAIHTKSSYHINNSKQVISLNLGNLKKNILLIIPDLINLKNLAYLNLYHNSINDIKFIKNFTNLQILRLENNNIRDISPILELKKLTYLDLSYNPIESFEVFKKLQSLKTLWISSINITKIDFLKGLNNLTDLGLGGNRITSISVLKDFTNLTQLNLVHNNIKTISFLKNLKKLTKLSLIGNKVKLIPEIIFNNLVLINDWAEILERNPLKNPPLEIISQGKNAIENYFSQIEKEEGKTDYLFETKLLVIGEGGTGKTTFTKKMLDPKSKLPQAKDTTLGIEVGKWNFEIQFPKLKELGEVDFNVNLWDFGGQKIYQGTHQIFFSDKSFYVLLTDTRENQTDFSYWLNTVQQLGGDNSSLIIVINKKFGHEYRFDKSGFMNHFGNLIKDVVELDLSCSEKDILGLQDKVKTHLKLLSGIGDPLPPSWINIRRDLVNETQNFISFDRFREICYAHDIKETGMINTISGYFNRIGTFTHYIDDPLLQERIYLNSNWLVKTVYEVLDNSIAKSKRGHLTETDIKYIWGKNELHYEINKLTQLMHKFGLMYHIQDTQDYVVPAHLSTETPYNKWPHETKTNILKFIYEFDKYMPQGIMSRLIVALNNYIKNHNLVWHRGLNIESDGAFAEIIEGYGGTNSFEIRIVGNNKIELLTIIRERFAEVLKPFNRLNYKQKIPCVCTECKESRDPAFHEYNLLLKFREKNVDSQCTKTGNMVSSDELLKITRISSIDDKLKLDSQFKTSRTIKIFLASSSELKRDREQFEIFINRENKKLNKEGIFLELTVWEDFLDAMSYQGLQKEYNAAIEVSDIFISLFFSKVGKFTDEEFNLAYGNYILTGKPFVYTYFKDSNIKAGQIKEEDINSKFAFQKKLNNLGHYPTSYINIDNLKYQFKNQLEKLYNIL